MAFDKRTWKARQGTGLNKFSIDGATPVSIVNQPDTVTQQGDALSAGNLNDLETRIDNAFTDVENGKADKTTTDDLQNQIINIDGDIDNIEALIGGEAQTENVDDTPISVTSRLIHHANMLPNGSFGIIGAKSVVSSGAIVDLPPTSFLVRGINLWDEEMEEGSFNSDGEKTPNSSYLRTVNFIRVQPSHEYYFKAPYTATALFYGSDEGLVYIQSSLNADQSFTSPNNAYYMVFTINKSAYGHNTYNNDIQICDNSLPTSLKTTYHSHDFHTVDTSFMTGKKGINTSVYDYVENVEDGGILRRKEHGKVGEYTVTGNESFSTTGNGHHYLPLSVIGDAKPTSSNNEVANVLCGFATGASYNTLNASGDTTDGIGVSDAGRIIVGDVQYTDWANLVGKKIYYELATESVTYDAPIPSFPISDYCTIDPICSVPTDVPFSVKSISANTLIAQINENRENIQTNATQIQILNKRVTNLEAKAGDEIAVTYPSATYGMDEVPPSVAPYSKVDNLIGVGRVHNQLLPDLTSGNGYGYLNYSTTVSFFDGVMTLTGSGSAVDVKNSNQSFMNGHSYVVLISFNLVSTNVSIGTTNHATAIYTSSSDPTDTWVTKVFVYTASDTSRLYVVGRTGIQIKNFNLKDLNVHFNTSDLSFLGATDSAKLATIQRDYPDLLVPSAYDSGTVVFPTYDKVEAEGKTTLTLPSAVTLKGVGSVHEVYNLESGEITQPIGSYTFDGTEAWSASGSSVAFLHSISWGAKGQSSPNPANIITDAGLIADITGNIYNGVTPYTIGISTAGDGIWVYAPSVTTASGMQSFMEGKTVYFELAIPATPQSVTPMPDCFIEVEGGGTIKPNQTQTIKIDSSMTAEYLII